ncbi:hypothetical protein [Dactylosporangium sp. NPDC051541]|uniref:hypothetical protein n=1 Tax=Dactylosporangium sp. NPDC051541 TaxID=3363977 RepID=UPI003797C786
MAVRRMPPAPIIAAAVVLTALTSCQASDAPTAAPTPTRPATASSTAPPPIPSSAIPSPAPTGPCATGTCRLEVKVGDAVTVPDRYGLGPIQITAITPSSVEMTAPLTGSGFSVTGCSGGGGVSSQGGGGVALTCRLNTPGTINNAMILEIAEIHAPTAVLTIKPAG